MANNILNSILTYAQEYQTGCLQVHNFKNHKQPWLLYFRLGRLFWAGGGEQEQRRVYRQLLKQLSKEARQVLLLAQKVNWDSQSAYYEFLAYLFKQEKITIEQFIAIKNEIMLEVLFDVLQADLIQEGAPYTNSSGLFWQWYEGCRPESYVPIDSTIAKSTEELVTQAQQDWKQWQKANLSDYSPNRAPVMIDQEQIEQVTAPKTYQNMQRLITGKQSLRDIAVATQANLLQVAKILLGYYQKGWVQFQDLSDLNWEDIAPKPQSVEPPTTLQTPSSAKEGKFCVACVDDSLQVIQTLETIIKQGGHSFIGINDPLRASATLLKAKPDLIFLDLIMPTTNGYEICTQLRRVSSLQNVPIIILTGKDGLIDRVRAKMVGATQYISKPVQPHIILEVMQKYLPHQSQNNSEINSYLAASYS